MARGVAPGLGGMRPVREDAAEEPLPQSAQIVDLRAIADTVRQVADDIDPDQDEQSEERNPDFDANLAEEMSDYDLNHLAMTLLRGIEADLESRKDWEAMVERAIRFMGLIYEEASGELAADGSISKAWHTLMLEAVITFWANAHAEFLPAEGPVKVRDDKPPTAGHNGGPPLDDAGPDRTALAEALEMDFNHYLTVGDKQYYRDFSRMLWSLGPKGTEFRKVYFNPLRNLPISEWVKSENLIVSNDAADLSTAGRVTERIMMRHADVKRMQWKGIWLDRGLGQPTDQPTRIEEIVARTEGIRARIDIPADQLHTIYECSCELDLPGFEHEEDGEATGLPLPYRVTLDKDSRQVLEIRRNWKEGDEDFKARQRYVMFGLLPGFGLYFLGFVHILGNTERALTAMEREVIDNTMMAIFPGFFAAKGAFSRGNTQVRVGPMGTVEVDLGMAKSVNDVVSPIKVADISQAHMALFEKVEENGRKISGTAELPVGEGAADIPVGTMIAMLEQKTKVMAAVHKGIHASRAEELQLLRDLMAEDPSVLAKLAKSGTRWDEVEEEFEDFDLVPSSDPNTPSHIHRVMQAVGLGQMAQQFPQYANGIEIFKEILTVLRVEDPDRFVNPNPGAMPNPQAMQAQTKLQIAQVQAQGKMADTQARAQQSAADRQSKLQVAMIQSRDDQVKAAGEDQAATARAAADNNAQAVDAERERAHDLEMQQREHAHEARQTAMQPQPKRFI
jgi:hypothetical protein